MTCQELKSHFECTSMTGADASSEAMIAGHIASCTKCRKSVEAQKQLHTGLALLRESVPAPSSSLDDVVLANYRKQVLELGNPRAAAKMRRPVFTVALRWSLAAAALALVAILLWPRKQPGKAFAGPVTHPAAVLSARLNRPETRPVPQSVSARKRTDHGARRVSVPVPPANLSMPAPEGFRSLMYCDELSCGGAMDVVRIQLPPSALGLMPPREQSSSVVFADVLVGADGIARGIRIVR